MVKFWRKQAFACENGQSTPQARRAAGALSGWVGICANGLLFLGKLLVGIFSGSVSITADALNNLSDASASLLTLVGFQLASKPADGHHPYGHARFEYLSGLAVAAMILLIGFELAQTAVGKILAPKPVAVSGVTAAVLLASIAVKLGLWRFNWYLGSRMHSTTLLAAAADSRNDCISTGAVLAAALLERFLDWRVDGIMGLGVAVFILYSGWQLVKETVSPLLGENPDPELRQKIVDYVQENPKVLGYHDLMVHDYGPGRQYASLHVEMDYREDSLGCHDIIDDMERECLRSHGVHLMIHYDPVVTDDPALTALKERTAASLAAWDHRLSLHDFRMVPGRSHMNLVFDVSLPAELQGQEQVIAQQIGEELNGQDSMKYHVKITFDVV